MSRKSWGNFLYWPGLFCLLACTAYFSTLDASCVPWLTSPKGQRIRKLPRAFPQDIKLNSPLTELLAIRQAKLITGTAQDFWPRATFAQSALALNFIIPDHLQWVMAQALVVAAQEVWAARQVEFQVVNQSYENHTLSYLELLPHGDAPENKIAALAAQKYKGLKIIYHPYHLIHHNLYAAYEINNHQIYLSHEIIKKFSARDYNFLHELRHAKQRVRLQERVPSPYYGDTVSSAAPKVGESFYHHFISHDELLTYYKNIKALIYQWQRAALAGHWHTYRRKAKVLHMFARQALFIAQKLDEVAQTWITAVANNTAQIKYQKNKGIVEAMLTMQVNGHQRTTHLPLVAAHDLADPAKDQILMLQLESFAHAAHHFLDIFTALREYLAKTSNHVFNLKDFAEFEPWLQRPIP
jgi:hypothetical protein